MVISIESFVFVTYFILVSIKAAHNFFVIKMNIDLYFIVLFIILYLQILLKSNCILLSFKTSILSIRDKFYG